MLLFLFLRIDTYMTVPMTYIRIPEYTYLIISTPIEH
jgi:hypothetical protein